MPCQLCVLWKFSATLSEARSEIACFIQANVPLDGVAEVDVPAAPRDVAAAGVAGVVATSGPEDARSSLLTRRSLCILVSAYHMDDASRNPAATRPATMRTVACRLTGML